MDDLTLRRQHAVQSLVPGQILVLSTPHIPNRDWKYFVLAVDDGPRPLLMSINTYPSRLARGNPDIAKAQILIRPDGYSFLDHDSFIDAANPKAPYTREQIVTQIVTDPRSVMGPLTLEHRVAVVEAANQCCTVSNVHRRAIAEYLIR